MTDQSRNGWPSDESRQSNRSGQPSGKGQSGGKGQGGGKGQAGRSGPPVGDLIGDMQRWILRSSAKNMSREISGQVRKKLGADRSEPKDVWGTATTEPPRGDLGEAPECAWCPICRAARRIRESGPGFGSQIAGAGDAVAAAVQEALGAFDTVLSRQGSAPGADRPRRGAPAPAAPSSEAPAPAAPGYAAPGPEAPAPAAPGYAAPGPEAPGSEAPAPAAPSPEAPAAPSPDAPQPGATEASSPDSAPAGPAPWWPAAPDHGDPAGQVEDPDYGPDDRH